MHETCEHLLAQQLKELMKYGVVQKQVFNLVCKHSEYSFINLGRTLIPINQLRQWGYGFRPQMEEILARRM